MNLKRIERRVLKILNKWEYFDPAIYKIQLVLLNLFEVNTLFQMEWFIISCNVHAH